MSDYDQMCCFSVGYIIWIAICAVIGFRINFIEGSVYGFFFGLGSGPILTMLIKLTEFKLADNRKSSEDLYSDLDVESEPPVALHTPTRRTISKTVKLYVWQRDQGRCVECGSKENLEYDHIIPVSKGGSNTERNIQLLCEKCNRTKSDKIE